MPSPPLGSNYYQVPCACRPCVHMVTSYDQHATWVWCDPCVDRLCEHCRDRVEV